MRSFQIYVDEHEFKLATAPPEHALEDLHPEEIERLLQKTNGQRFLSATALKLARRLTGQDVPILHRPDGAPEFTAGDWRLSLSHKNDLVAAAVSRAPVGVDVERVDAIENLDLFARFACAPEEDPDQLARAWSTDHRRALVSMWSLKESYFKARGADLVPQDVRVRFDGRLSLEARTNEIWRPVETGKIHLSFEDEHVLSAVVLAARI